jgi:hypothetical protein
MRGHIDLREAEMAARGTLQQHAGGEQTVDLVGASTR